MADAPYEVKRMAPVQSSTTARLQRARAAPTSALVTYVAGASSMISPGLAGSNRPPDRGRYGQEGVPGEPRQ